MPAGQEAFEQTAFKYAVKNAALHGGKAEVGAIVGKLKALFPDASMPELVQAAKESVQKTNALSADEIQKQFAVFEQEGYELKPREKKPGLPDLDWAENGNEKVVTRFAPNPSGYMHLGHCRAAIVSAEYAKKYNGKFILRFDDTDPKVKKPIPDADKAFTEDLNWLGYPPQTTVFASDRFELYYTYMRKVLEMGKAYVCTCENEKFKELKKKKTACPCRGLSAEKQLDRFQQMLDHRLKEGQAALRIKTDLNHPDPSVRDWWAAKIVDKPEYPPVKNRRVFPSYNFASAIDDQELGITLIIRGQEHAQNATKQKFLYDFFGWTYPRLLNTGRLMLKEMVLSKSKMLVLMKQPGFLGAEDPRLATVKALRKKGFLPQVLRETMIDIGAKPQDALLSLEKLESINRHLIDPVSDRIVFLKKPVELQVKNAPALEVKIQKHPDFPDKGYKKYALKKGTETFWIEKEQAATLKTGAQVQLKQAYAIKISKKSASQVEAEFVSSEFKKGSTIVHWLLPSETVETEIVMQDATLLKGVAEKTLASYQPETHIQLEKTGYVFLEKNGSKKVMCRYTHE